jgi:putative exporter of polyketide antibiotics
LKGRPGERLALLLLLLLVLLVMMTTNSLQQQRKPTASTLSKRHGWHSQQQQTQGHAGLSLHLGSGALSAFALACMLADCSIWCAADESGVGSMGLLQINE